MEGESGEVFGFEPVLDTLHELLDADVGQGQAVVLSCGGVNALGANAVVAFDDQSHARGVGGDAGVVWRFGDVLTWEAEAAIEARHELEQLGDVLESVSYTHLTLPTSR